MVLTQCSDAVRQTMIFICTNHTNIPFRNISSINLHCKEIKVPSFILKDFLVHFTYSQ